jgi:HSP20 family molecular chaperone IbpA
MPGEIDDSNVTAMLEDGVLTIRVPKSQRGKSRRIAVNH